MPRRPEKYFIDNCLPPKLAEMLRTLGVDVQHLSERMARDSKDVDWIPVVAKEGLVAVTTDNRINSPPQEKGALHAAQLHVVFLAGGVSNLIFWEQAKFVITHWPAIEKAAERMKAGECCRVTMSGKVEDLK
jgi:predicted nuclease of predicted toxin-antitoxin system